MREETGKEMFFFLFPLKNLQKKDKTRKFLASDIMTTLGSTSSADKTYREHFFFHPPAAGFVGGNACASVVVFLAPREREKKDGRGPPPELFLMERIPNC